MGLFGEVVAPILLSQVFHSPVLNRHNRYVLTVIYPPMHMDNFFTLNKVGAWAVEGVAVYLFVAIATLFLGSGKYV